MNAEKWYTGNANIDGGKNRGWLLGSFMNPAGGVRLTEAVEIKWGVHAAGEQRAVWTSGDQRTTVLILVAGRFRLDLTASSVTLAEQGDYVVWGAGVDHSWQALEDSVLVTVRWPSKESAET